MKKRVLIGKSWLFSTLLFSSVCFAQVTEEWVARETAPGVDGARSLALDNAGNVYVTGSAAGTGTGMDYLTIKYNAEGVKQWEARFNGAANMDDDAFSIAVDSNGNVYVTGRSRNAIGNDIATIKYNSAGVMQWVATHNGWGKWIAVDGDGNVYVTGSAEEVATDDDFITIKYNTNGVEQWVATYDGAGRSDVANALALDAAGNVYVTGESAAGDDLDEQDMDYTTIKYDNDGIELWVKKYDGPVLGNHFDEALAITVDAAGNVYVTGRSSATAAEGSTDYATVKYDANGNELWAVRYNGPGNSIDDALAIAVDNDNNVYVTGYSAAEPDEANYDYATVRYDANGNQVWVNRYNGPANKNDQATSLTLDGAGNVYVTGRSIGIGTENDFATIKYNTTGVEQWVARYNGPANSHDGTGIFMGFFTSHPIAVDAAGNVYVTGLSTGIGTDIDYTTIKYSQASLTACGEKGDKVLICHKGKTTLCVSQSAASKHLDHGDQLGACASTANARISQVDISAGAPPSLFHVSVVPNPAVASTKIVYELPVDGRVSITVFDMLGRQITTLVDANKQAGSHYADLNVATLQKGMYYYRITVKTAKQVWFKTGKINVVNN